MRAGAVAGLGADYYALGRNVAAILVRILAGDSPSDIAPRANPATNLSINTRAAAALELRIPQAILDRAQNIYR